MTEQIKCEECTDLQCDITNHPTLDGFRSEVHQLRYAENPDETWEQTALRVGGGIALVEKSTEDKLRYAKLYSHLIESTDFIPGGRILRNTGKVKGNLLNCFVLGVQDTIESIAMDLLGPGLIISKYGGGIGFNASTIRPAGEELRSQGNNSRSSGTISFIDVLDNALQVIRGGGDRRGAGLALLDVKHPEIYNFIKAKHEAKKLNNFNLSVGITQSFIKAVKLDREWELIFNNKVYQTVKARDLWAFLIDHAWRTAEPGIINWDKMQRENNLYYCEKISSTNPCGEVPLPENGACCLGSINVSNMYDEKKNEINWKKLKETIYLAVRFLDSVLDVTFYPLSQIASAVQATRRIGLGVMGLHHLMLKLGIKEYGSDEALEFIDDFFRRFRDNTYLSSTLLAQERGPFDRFDRDKYSESEFVGKLPRRVRQSIRTMGIRNATVNSIAPTGTISLVAGVSQGIEPIFSPIYERRYYADGNVKKILEADSLFREYVLSSKDVSHFIGAYDITPKQHLEVQSTVQQYIDNSISKTINMKKDFPKEKLEELLLEHVDEIKGTTVYREGCRGEEVLTPCEYKVSREQLIKLLKN